MRALYYADASLTGDAAFMLRAMQECDWSAEVLDFADESLKCDKGFLMMAAREDVAAMNFADPSVGLAGDTAEEKFAQLELLIASDLMRTLHRSAEPRITDVLAAMGGKLAPTVCVEASVNLAALGTRFFGRFPPRVLRFFRPRSSRAEAGRSLFLDAMATPEPVHYED